MMDKNPGERQTFLPWAYFLRLGFFAMIFLSLGIFAKGQASEEMWDAKGPFSLEEAIALAHEKNPDLQAAKYRIEEARAKIREATAAFYPHLQARMLYLRSDHPLAANGMLVAQRRLDFAKDINHPGYVSDYRPEIMLKWPLFQGGERIFRRQAEKLGMQAAQLDEAAMGNALAASVSSAFYALVRAPEALEVARKSAKTIEKELQLARVRVKEGTALKSEALSLEARLAEVRQEEIAAENAQESARSALATLLAFPLEKELRVQEEAAPLPALPSSLEELLNRAMTHRPDLLATQREKARREKELLVAKSERLPRLNAFALYGQDGDEPGFSATRDNFTVGVNAELDLFTGFATSAKIQQAQHKLLEARAMEESARLRTNKEVKDAYLDLKDTLARFEAARAEERAAQAALDLVQKEYRGGVATVTRFLEAETQTARARLGTIAARFDAYVAQAELRRATGER